MSIFSDLKHLVVEEEESTEVPQAQKLQVTSFTATTLGNIIAAPPTAFPIDNDIYKELLGKTDFNTTTIGQSLAAKLEPLKGTNLDEKTMHTVALKLGASEGLTPQSILSVFDTLKTTLQTESDQFNQAAQAATEREVNGRQARLQEISQKIQDLQREQSQVQEELIQQQTKIQRGQMLFKTAFENRMAELEHQRQHLANLLL